MGYLLIIFILFVIIGAPSLAYLIMRQVRRIRTEAGIKDEKGVNSNIGVIYILVLAGSVVIVILLFIALTFAVNMFFPNLGK